MGGSTDKQNEAEDQVVGLPSITSEDGQLDNAPACPTTTCPHHEVAELVEAHATLKKVELQTWVAKFLVGLVSLVFAFIVSIVLYTVAYADDEKAIEAMLTVLRYIKDIIASIVEVLK